MKVKRLLGSLAVAGTLTALSIGTAVPAFAAPHITFTMTPSDGTQVPGQLDPHGIRLAVSAKSDCFGVCSMAGLSFTVKDPDGNTVASGSAPSNNGNFISASTTWDTQPTAKKNGNYTLVASAAQGAVLGLGGLTGNPPAETQQATLQVNNPPVAPTGVQTALDSSGVPLVSWSANPEPDIKGYQVYRSDGALQSGLIAGTSFRDASAPTGQALSYKVSALRFSPVDSSAGSVKCVPKSRNVHLGPRASAGAAVTPPADQAQQRAESHDHSKSPHGGRPPGLRRVP